MIGKGKSIAHTQASMSYGMNQEKDAEVVLKEYLYSDTPKDITKEFEIIQDQNHNCTKNTLSFVLSPTIKDGQNLEKEDLTKLTKLFMEEMKLQERQAVAFVHQDKEHKHVHLYVNRIDFDGKAYNDSFIGKRSQQAAEKVAEQMNLTTVRQVQIEKEFNMQEIRSEIRRRHELTMKELKPKGFDDYLKAMKANGVEVKPVINKQNQLQSFRYQFNGHNLKGSEVHRNMSMNNVAKEIANRSTVEINLKAKAPAATVKLLGKIVELTPSTTLKIAKVVVKKTIEIGMSI